MAARRHTGRWVMHATCRSYSSYLAVPGGLLTIESALTNSFTTAGILLEIGLAAPPLPLLPAAAPLLPVEAPLSPVAASFLPVDAARVPVAVANPPSSPFPAGGGGGRGVCQSRTSA